MGRPKNSHDKCTRKTRSAKWTPEQIALLTENYMKCTKDELVSILCKSYSAIRTKAIEMGLRKPCHITTIDNIATLIDVSGVYGLHNCDNDMIYIGSSCNIGRRLMNHLSRLESKSHYNKALQQDWNDGNVFDVYMFQHCTNGDLLKYEHELLRLPHTYNKNSAFSRIPKRVSLYAWSRITPKDEDECWEWNGTTNQSGYGEFRQYNKYYLAHRAVYAHFHPDDDSLTHSVVRHKCGNKLCCNPRHLETGSFQDNSRDYFDQATPEELSKWYEHLDKMVELRLQNNSYQKIADEIGCHQASVIRLIQKYRPDVFSREVPCSRYNGWRERVVKFEYKGEKLTLRELLDLPECCVSKQVLRDRLKHGWDVGEAITTPHERKKTGQQITAFGETKRLIDWVCDDRSRCSEDSLRTRLAQGWKPEEALVTPCRKQQKIPASQHAVICKRYSDGETQTSIATDYGVSPTTICLIIRKVVGSLA